MVKDPASQETKKAEWVSALVEAGQGICGEFPSKIVTT